MILATFSFSSQGLGTGMRLQDRTGERAEGEGAQRDHGKVNTNSTAIFHKEKKLVHRFLNLL